MFLYFATREVHWELVSDLTTEDCISALRHLMARRGKVANIYTDNGTNFVGASRELKEMRRLFARED